MTIELARTEGYSPQSSRPGWNIVADMTPHELVVRRRLDILRRRIAVVLVMVVALCAAAFGYATLRHMSAEDDAEAEAARTTALTRSAARYAGITQIESTVSGLDAQVAAVMAKDVDVARVVAAIREALPTSMTMQSISVTLDQSSSTDATTGTAAGLDASGRPTIGTVTISGSGRGLDDLPAFVDDLMTVRGFVDVLPTSNAVSDGSAQFNVTFTLTDLLRTHRFDGNKGSK